MKKQKYKGVELDQNKLEQIGLFEYLILYMQKFEELYFTKKQVEKMLRTNEPFEFMSKEIYKHTKEQHGDYLKSQERIHRSDELKKKKEFSYNESL